MLKKTRGFIFRVVILVNSVKSRFVSLSRVSVSISLPLIMNLLLVAVGRSIAYRVKSSFWVFPPGQVFCVRLVTPQTLLEPNSRVNGDLSAWVTEATISNITVGVST